MMEPDYRTRLGFAICIEKNFAAYGFKFRDRARGVAKLHSGTSVIICYLLTILFIKFSLSIGLREGSPSEVATIIQESRGEGSEKVLHILPMLYLIIALPRRDLLAISLM
jgi:hypothetical protein